MAIVANIYPFVIGVDTHAKEHVFAVLKPSGELIGIESFRTNSLSAAIKWVQKVTGGDMDTLWVIEGTATYGAVLSSKAQVAGYRVVEAARMNAKAHKAAGKTDVLDAHRIAAAVLPLDESRLRDPRSHTDIQAALQILTTTREQMTDYRTSLINSLTALLRQWELDVDARRPLTNAQIVEISKWRNKTSSDFGFAVARAEAIRLAKHIINLTEQIDANYKTITELVETSPAKALLEETGIGPINAAIIYCAWSHQGRVRSAEAFKSLAGVNPIPASSGNTTRHRLNRGGDRRLNSALYIAAITRETYDPATKQYIAKRTEEGKTRKEIRRCIKTYLARKVFRILNQAANIQAVSVPIGALTPVA